MLQPTQLESIIKSSSVVNNITKGVIRVLNKYYYISVCTVTPVAE